MRKLLAAIVAASLLIPVIASPVAAADYGPCSAFNWGYPTWHVLRAQGGRYYTQARGQAVARAIHSCTLNQNGAVFVLPANIQTADGSLLVQVGFRYTNGGGLRFWATDGDNTGGSGSDMSFTFLPRGGDLYEFEITQYTQPQTGTRYWRLYVRNKTNTNEWGYRDLVRHQDFGDRVWYGIEAHNSQDQFGGPDSTNRINIDYPAYRYIGDTGVYTYLTGTTNFYWANDEAWRPACWIAGATTIGADAYTRLSGYSNC